MAKFSKRIITDQDGNFLFEAYFFYCPGCENLHHVTIRANGLPIWRMGGEGDLLTFSPSLLIPTYPRCHSYIRAGKIQFLGDCTHALKGQTVELPELTEWFGKEGEK